MFVLAFGFMLIFHYWFRANDRCQLKSLMLLAMEYFKQGKTKSQKPVDQ